MSSAEAWTLFVDDAPGLLGTIKKRLTAIGYKTVEISVDIEEALRIIASRNIAHVVGDWKMAGGGLAFLRGIRQEYPNIRCTLLSGFTRSLPREERSSLEALGIEILDKDEVNTERLARLVGHVGATPSYDAEDDLDTESQEAVGKPLVEAGSGPADVIAEQRLRIEELERSIADRDSIIHAFASDLIEELQGIGSMEKSGAIIGSRSSMSVLDIVREIKILSPLGRRFLALDRAARHRLMRLKP